MYGCMAFSAICLVQATVISITTCRTFLGVGADKPSNKTHMAHRMAYVVLVAAISLM